MVDKVKVTIGMCVKNAETTVEEAIKSLLIQDFPHELMKTIVVDGQSQDRTVNIAKRTLSKSDIKSTILRENEGLGSARQMVVNNATGDYIVWVDGDMILSSDYIGRLVGFMEKNPNVGIASGVHGVLPEANLIAALEDIAYIAVDYAFRGRNSAILPGTAGAIFRIKAIKQCSGFNEALKGVGEDIDVAHRLKEIGWLIHRGVPTVFYEKRKKSPKELWDHYFWYGYGGYSALRSNRKIFSLYKMTPLFGLVAGVRYSAFAYKITHQKIVFLLPLHYVFKRIAWCFGFAKGQIE